MLSSKGGKPSLSLLLWRILLFSLTPLFAKMLERSREIPLKGLLLSSPTPPSASPTFLPSLSFVTTFFFKVCPTLTIQPRSLFSLCFYYWVWKQRLQRQRCELQLLLGKKAFISFQLLVNFHGFLLLWSRLFLIVLLSFFSTAFTKILRWCCLVASLEPIFRTWLRPRWFVLILSCKSAPPHSSVFLEDQLLCLLRRYVIRRVR